MPILGEPLEPDPDNAGEGKRSMHHKQFPRPIFFIYLALSLFWTCLAFAQTELPDSETKPIEVSVTADAISQDLTTSLANQTQIDSQKLRESQAMQFQDLLGSIPDLNWAGGSSRPRFFQIRGIGELEQYEGAPNSAVAFLIDDFDLSSLGSSAALFDLEQVNILRGPQGFGFGPSALAGLVQLRSKDPTPFLTSRIELAARNDQFFSGAAALSGPLSSTQKDLLFRISAQNGRSNGFRDNAFLDRDDTNQRDESTMQAKLRWLASDLLVVDLNLLRLNFDNGYDAFAIDNGFTTQSDFPGVDKQETNAAALKFNVDLGQRSSLVNTSTISDSDTRYSFDGDWGNNPFWTPYDPYDYFSLTERNRTVYSNELRVLSTPTAGALGQEWNWLAGIYQQRLLEDSNNQEFSDSIAYDQLQSDFDSKINAAFGALEVPIRSGTALSLGLRAEQRASQYDDSKSADFSPDENMYGALIGLKQQLLPEHLLLASVSRGYKGGGFNSGANVPRDHLTFDQENLWNFELGLESSWLEEQIQSRLAVFYSLRRDQQIKLALQDDPSDPLSFTYVTDNAASGQNFGSELEVEVKGSERLAIFGRGALLDAEFDDFSSGGRDLSGRDQSHAPNWQYSVGFKYLLCDKLFLRSEVIGVDAFYFDDSHDQRSDPYHLTNATLGYNGSNWSVSIWGRNLFEQNYAVRGFFFGNEPPDFPDKLYVQRGDPRQFGITFDLFF